VSKKKQKNKKKYEVNKSEHTSSGLLQKIKQRQSKGLESKDEKSLVSLHLETTGKIDGVMEEIGEINIKDEEKQGFFERFDFSLSNRLGKRGSSGKDFDLPEFLETPPFQTNVKSKQAVLEKMGSLRTSSAKFSDKNSVAQTKTVQIPKSETALPVEDISNLITKYKLDSPLISEMEIKDEKKHSKTSKTKEQDKWMFTGIKGFDDLLEKGIPTGANIIVAGGPGCGKTIFCSQAIYNKASEGNDCVFLSMEERPDRLRDHMLNFGFKVEEISRSDEEIILRANGKGRIALKRLQPIRLARSIEALLEKASGTLPVDIDLVLDFIPEGFDACLLALDSISAIETAFSGTKRQYRIYIEQLFRYFEEMNLTTFMITESMDAPHKFSNTGVEEFLSDGIFVFYNFQGVKKRTRGVEIFKLRGASHSQRIVPMEITSDGLKISSDDSCKNQA